jgi:prevent-host-death family protein
MYISMYIVGVTRKYSVAEARSSLPTIIDRAESGLGVELTRRGKPVAVVISVREFERLRGDGARFGAAYKRFLQTHSPEEVGLDDDFFASGRERGSGREVSL